MQHWIKWVGRFSGSLALALSSFFGNAATPADTTPTDRASTNQPLRLVIGRFHVPGSADASLLQQSDAITGFLAAELSKDPGFELVEREELDRMLKEAHLALSSASKEPDLIKVGKLLRADWFLLGTLRQSKKTNISVVKIVDARTGIIRDLAAIVMQRDPMRSAKAISDFVRNSANVVTKTRPRQFLSIGQFENVGVTNHFSDFAHNIRETVEQTYQGTSVSVVERDSIHALHNELRLNLMGLAQSTGRDQAAQPAFLIVDGMYQPMQDDQFKVSLFLRVQLVGAKPTLHSITDVPGKSLNDKVIAAINAEIKGISTNFHRASSKDEARLQFAHGQERSGVFHKDMGYAWLGGYFIRGNLGKRRQNINAAIKAYEAALFLDPDYDEAKFYLAFCLDSPDIQNHELARDYYFELLAGSTNETLVELSRACMEKSFLERNDQEGLALLSTQAATNRVLRTMQEKAERLGKPLETLPAEERTLLEQALESFRNRIRSECREDEQAWNAGSTVFTYARLLKHFDEIFAASNRNTNDARQAIDTLLSELTKEFPSLEVHFLGTYLVWAHEASIANQKRLEQLLDELAQRPGRLQAQKISSRALLDGITENAFTAKYYSLARKAGNLFSQLVDQQAPPPAARRINIYLAYCDREQGNWQKAREAFEAMGNLEMAFPARGPWGKGPFYFKAPQAAYECRQHLGIEGPATAPPSQPEKDPPPAFALGTPVLTLAQQFVFVSEGENIWLGDGIVPSFWNKAGGKVVEIETPDNLDRNITCIAPGKTSVWFGTAGSGLVEFDKVNKRTTVHSDGLFLPNVTALYLTDQRLWLGYGKESEGGLGYLDLQSKKFYGMTPDLNTNSVLPYAFSLYKGSVQLPFEIPPKGKVVGIAQSSPQELWLAVQPEGIRRYSFVSNAWNLRGDEWNSFNNGLVSLRTLRFLALTPQFVIFGGDDYGGNLGIHHRKYTQTRLVNVKQWLPEWVYDRYRFKGFLAVAVDGNKLWAGGEGFLALIDLPSGRVQKLCDLRDGHIRVHGLQVDGNDLWVAAKNKLYRLPRYDRLAVSSSPKPGL